MQIPVGKNVLELNELRKPREKILRLCYWHNAYRALFPVASYFSSLKLTRKYQERYLLDGVAQKESNSGKKPI